MWALHRISNMDVGMHLDMLTEGHIYRQYMNFIYGHRYAQTHNHPDSHMANRANLLYNTGVRRHKLTYGHAHSTHGQYTESPT